MLRRAVVRPVIVLICLIGLPGLTGPSEVAAASAVAGPEAVERLRRDGATELRVERHPATGAVRFLRLAPGSLPLDGGSAPERAAAFLARHGEVFGVGDPSAELKLAGQHTDPHGGRHVSYRQFHRGVPVFAGMLRVHFDAAGRLTAANGTFLPDLDVDVTPSWKAGAAAARAVADVRRRHEPRAGFEIGARGIRLVVYRAGLARRVEGRAHLAWEVETGDGDVVREFVYVDAHTGKIVERIPGVYEALERRVHQPAFDDQVIWSEGDPLPYDTGEPDNDDQVNDLLEATLDVYDLFVNLSGGSFPAWDGADGTMHSVWKSDSIPCPNATWNGTSTNFCDGTASDDVVAHEWAHAYTESTHGLIYLWQPGALNEAYSDIFGEIVDVLNGAGTDSPGAGRVPGDCSTFGGTPPPSLTIDAPASLAGERAVAGAVFNPDATLTVSGAIQLGEDGDDGGGAESATDGCQPLIGFVPGRIALIDRGTCPFVDKVDNAEAAGAAGAIIVNTSDSTFTMSGSGSPSIPAVMIGQSDGQELAAALAGGVDGTIELTQPTAASVRWLIGEDASGLGGAIRDLWNPACFGDPSRVGDVRYWCSVFDNGGVHSNSGVPNHAFALLADGGSSNGVTVPAIGLTKAAHLYWRAATVYQVPDTDFADHAVALEQSCDDLVGSPLADPVTGTPGPTMTVADCEAVDAAIQATELTAPPSCEFAPLLAPDPPPVACGTLSFADDFGADPAGRWERTNEGVFGEYVPRDWAWTSELPPGGAAPAMFALDDRGLGNCVEGDDDQSGRMRLTSPPVPLVGDAVLRFRHWVATETDYDGGNLKVSVDGGPFVVVEERDILFNTYPGTLVDSESGNTNPLAGEPAFTGSDGGEVHGSWGESHVDLSPYAAAGDAVRLQYDFGVDGCNGLVGWYVDDVAVCQAEAVAGAVPDGSGAAAALLAGKAGGGEVQLDWSPSCLASDQDYAVYEGAVGSWAGHAPATCSTAGATSWSLTPGAGARFFLVVPVNGDREGGYGSDSSGTPRPASAGACFAQAASGVCP